MKSAQQVLRASRLNSLSHHVQSEVMTQVAYRFDSHGIVTVGFYCLNKRFVNFDARHGKFCQVGERGVACAEIINSKMRAKLADLIQSANYPLWVIHDAGFGN